MLVNSRAALTVPPLYVGYHSAVVLYGTDGLMNNGAGFPWPNIRRLHGRADPDSVLMLVKGKERDSSLVTGQDVVRKSLPG